MERESFESPEIAQILNSSFIPIKIDREERPDIDAIYMSYVQVGTSTSWLRLSANFLVPKLRLGNIRPRQLLWLTPHQRVELLIQN